MILSDELIKIEIQLDDLRKQWVKATPVMRKYIEARARMIKEKRTRLNEMI